MPQVETISERESTKGWQFAAQVLDDDGTLRKHEVTLAWADYNLWSSDGSDEPAKVMEAAVAFLVARIRAAELPTKFDASIARRRFADADDWIPGLIV